MTRTSSVLCLCVLAACGAEAAEPETAEPEVERPTVEVEAEPPAAVEEPPAAPSGEATPALTVTRLGGSDTAPSSRRERPPPSARATLEGGAVTISLRNFSYYCSPAPTFDARIEAATLIVQAAAPTGPTARCVGPHSAQLRIAGVPAGSYALSVRSREGREVAQSRVTVPE